MSKFHVLGGWEGGGLVFFSSWVRCMPLWVAPDTTRPSSRNSGPLSRAHTTCVVPSCAQEATFNFVLRLYRHEPRLLSSVCLTAIQTHLYDVILGVAGIETPREGELDDVIALYIVEPVAVLLMVHVQTAVRVCPSVLQLWTSVRMAVQITGDCAVPGLFAAHTVANIQHTHCAEPSHLLACITPTLKAPPFQTPRHAV